MTRPLAEHAAEPSSPRTPISIRMRRLTWRRLVAFGVVHGLIGLHLWLWYARGWHHIGAIDMQELFRNFIERNVLTAGGLFFLTFLGLTLVWGRWFCGWICHIGLSYDLLESLYHKLGIRMRGFPLRFGPLAAGFVLIWYFAWEAIANRWTRTLPPVSIDLTLTEPWELLPGWLQGSLTLLMVLAIMPLFLGRRVFCRTLCPWGVLFGLGQRAARYKVRRTGDCTACGNCSTACPMDLDVSRMVNTRFHVAAIGCTGCMSCVAACPTDALSMSSPAKENREPQKRALPDGLEPVPLAVELGFWAMTAAVGLIYSELYGIGIFLAFCMGMCLGWLTIVWVPQLLSKRFRSGWAAAGLIVLLWAAVVKDGLGHYHYRAGLQAWEAREAQSCQHHLERADRFLWVSPNMLFYRLYAVYKATGQEEKGQALYQRYEVRRQRQGKERAGSSSQSGANP